MDFSLTEEQKLLQGMVRDFVQREIIPQAKSLEENHEFPREILEKLADLGILGMTVPPEYKGMKTDSISLVLALEELSRVLPSVAVIVSVHCSLFCYSILKFGTREQKEKYLPKAAEGKILGAFSLTEPGAGSDATSLRTNAVKNGNMYILNGTKNWVTTGSEAGALVLFAMTEIKPGIKKLSAFIVEKHFPGLKISKIEEKMGLHSSLTAEISLENCEVPAENLLGEEGKGASIAFHCLDCSRIGIAAQSVGLSQQAMEEAVKYAKQREAFGKKIAEFQSLQFMIADIATQLDAARLLTYKAADLCDKGKSFTKEAAMAKLFASEAANRIAYQALQIHGGYGYSKEFLIERLYRDARVFTIYEGTSEIQRLVISRFLLKK
ncbi:MAG: acyl-CoA dehydrogenase family protein [Candidatus Aenigmatarchaeota archaeon]|nr:MAG: acyl-CoA dehydrogenase family protein [Candidatus Aenigmarchaeota archaeon]